MEATTLNKDRQYWDILKGIGALAIVFGHTYPTIGVFVYLFHLVLFFFVSGFLYSEAKYGDEPFYFISKRLQSTWLRYTFYVVLLILLHNVFLDLHMLVDEPRYDLPHMAVNVCNAILFNCSETLGGALWFVPAMVVASGFFAGVVWFGRTAARMFGGKAVVKYVAIVAASAVFGAVGMVLSLRHVHLVYQIQVAFLVTPIYCAAYFLRTFCKDVGKWLKWYMGLAVGFGLYYVTTLGWGIEVVRGYVLGPFRFYLISFAGIYFCMTLAKYLRKVPYVRQYFAFIGKYSFEVMALHFVAIKLVDILYALCIGETDPNVYGVFVCAYSDELWPVYAVVGTVLPALAGALWTYVSRKTKKWTKPQAGESV